MCFCLQARIDECWYSRIMWYWESAPPQRGQVVSSVKNECLAKFRPCMCLSHRMRTHVDRERMDMLQPSPYIAAAHS